MKNTRFLLVFTIFICIQTFTGLFSAALPFDENSELSKPCPIDCSGNSDWSDFNPSVDTCVSLLKKDNPGQAVDLYTKISNLQDLRDRNAIRSELIEIINMLTVPDQLNWSDIVSLRSEVNRILSISYLGYDRCSLLDLAILELNNFEAVAVLVDKGAQVDAIFRASEGACDALGMCNNSLDLARFVGNNKITKLLIERGAQSSRLSTPALKPSSSRSSDCSLWAVTPSMNFGPTKIVASPMSGSLEDEDSEMFCEDNGSQFYAFQGPIPSIQEIDQTPEMKVADVLKIIQNLKEGASPVIYLKMIIALIRQSDGLSNLELREILNKPFSVYGLGYQMCSLIHLIIVERLDYVEFLVQFGADMNAELRIYPELAPPALAYLSCCHNAIDLAIRTKNDSMVEFLSKNGAHASEFFRSVLASESAKPKKKHFCTIC